MTASCGGGSGGLGAGGGVEWSRAGGGGGAGAGGGAAGFGDSGGGIGFRLVCVSPMPTSALGGGGAALAGLRMIIVFSKSAAVAAVGASLEYLSLCFSISTTSLFCRECFFTRLSVTIVPFVVAPGPLDAVLR